MEGLDRPREAAVRRWRTGPPQRLIRLRMESRLERLLAGSSHLVPRRPTQPLLDEVLDQMRLLCAPAPAGAVVELDGGGGLRLLSTVTWTSLPADAEALARHALAGRRRLLAGRHLVLTAAAEPDSMLALVLEVAAPPSPTMLALAQMLADKAGLTLANQRLQARLGDLDARLEDKVRERTRALEEANARLEALAACDPLTETLNRRRFLEMASCELERARRQGSPLSLCFADLDRFKSINDGHGHNAGDTVLRTFAARTRACLRKSDVLARWGGEEFVLLFPETPCLAAQAVAERIRAALAAAPVPVGATGLTVTVSIGLTQRRTAEDLPDMLLRADRALYRAKENGRDRVEVM